MLNLVKGDSLQFKCHPSLFPNYKWSNINALVAYLAFVEKDGDKLFSKCTTESSIGHVWFYPNIFVVPKHCRWLTSKS